MFGYLIIIMIISCTKWFTCMMVNVFHAKTTWNGQEWGVDEWANQLQINQETPPFIVVGIHNYPTTMV